MKISRFLFTVASALTLALLGGCITPGIVGQPNPVAYKPHNPANVRVKVSLSKQQVYVMEGDKALLVAATCVGFAGKETPVGEFRVFRKEAQKRSGSYGFYKTASGIHAGKAGQGAGYVGYPMPFWVEYQAGYGFHQGCVWPVPHSHGCLRLEKNVAPKFYALVHEGTSVSVQHTQPEDRTIGASVARPTNYADPDPSADILTSSRAFEKQAGSLLQPY